MSSRTRTIAGGVAAAVLGSGVTAALLAAPGLTSAAPPTSTEVSDDGGEDATAETDAGDARGDNLRELLQPLVDSGTLTAEQADSIVAELLAAVEAPIGPNIIAIPGPGFPGGGGFPGEGFPGQPGPQAPDVPAGRDDGQFHGRFRAISAEVIAEALGIEVDELRDELRSGSTIAEIAEANGVELQAVIDALVADYTERVTEWLEGEQSATSETDEPESTDPDETTDTTETTATTAA